MHYFLRTIKTVNKRFVIVLVLSIFSLSFCFVNTAFAADLVKPLFDTSNIVNPATIQAMVFLKPDLVPQFNGIVTSANEIYSKTLAGGFGADVAQKNAEVMIKNGWDLVQAENKAATALNDPGLFKSLGAIIADNVGFDQWMAIKSSDTVAKNELAEVAKARADFYDKKAEIQKTIGDTKGANVSTAMSAVNKKIYNEDKDGAIQCSLANPLGCIARLAFIILGVASWVLWLAAILFNVSIGYSLNMSQLLKDLPMVDIGWTTFRDVTNIFFIFIILYIAVNTILGNAKYNAKTLLGKVIYTAVLINFSLFFTQAMIDVSNILALQFYGKIKTTTQNINVSITGTATGNGGDSTYSEVSNKDGGISAAFTNALGMQTIWGTGAAEQGKTGGAAAGLSPNAQQKTAEGSGLNAGNLIIVGLGGTVFVLITAFVFFAGAIMFIIRAITLIFLMILSPLAFMAQILPSTQKYAGEWWDALIKNLIFPPVYILFLYMVISMLGKRPGGQDFFKLFTADGNFISTALNFFVLNMLMAGCLYVASKIGVGGSKWATSTGKKWGNALASTSLAPVRTIVGGAAGATGNLLKKSGLSTNFVGAAALRGLDNVRGIKIMGKSYKDQRKSSEESAKRNYDLNAETKQGRFESDDSFDDRKKRNQALGFRSLGVSADTKTGLPKLKRTVSRDSEGREVVKISVKQRGWGISASDKAVRSGKDIDEEAVQKKQTDFLLKGAKKAYSDAKKNVLFLYQSEAGENQIATATAAMREARNTLFNKEVELGLKEPKRQAGDNNQNQWQNRPRNPLA